MGKKSVVFIAKPISEWNVDEATEAYCCLCHAEE